MDDEEQRIGMLFLDDAAPCGAGARPCSTGKRWLAARATIDLRRLLPARRRWLPQEHERNDGEYLGFPELGGCSYRRLQSRMLWFAQQGPISATAATTMAATRSEAAFTFTARRIYYASRLRRARAIPPILRARRMLMTTMLLARVSSVITMIAVSSTV